MCVGRAGCVAFLRRADGLVGFDAEKGHHHDPRELLLAELEKVSGVVLMWIFSIGD